MKKSVAFTICLLLNILCLSANAQKISTRGKEFYVSFYKNQEEPTLPYPIYTKLFITARVAVTGTVVNPNTTYNVPFTVAAGAVTVINVPLAQAYNTSAGTVNNLGLVINSSDTIAVAAMNEEQSSSDAVNILQSAILGTDYIAACYEAQYTPGFPQFSFPTYTLIEATLNNTTVSITPATLTVDGHAAGVAYSVTLNRGQTYLVAAPRDLSGSQISITNGCKPIAVFSGNMLTSVPIGDCCAEHLYEQLLPVSLWGRAFITAPFKSRNSARIRVYAAYNNTSIAIDGTTVATINRGQFFETNTQNLAKYVVTNNPSQIMQFANSYDYDIQYGPVNPGDPTMMTLSPVEQQSKDILFLSPTTGIIASHFATIICKSADVSLTTLDGSGIASLFTTVAGNPLYSVATTNVAGGTHRIINPNGCTAYAYGTGTREGYGYNAGSDVESSNTYFTVNGATIIGATNINVCKGSPTVFNAVSADNIISYSWDFGDGSPIVMTNGTITQQSHVYTIGGIHTVKLTTVKAAANICAANNTTLSTVAITVTPDLGADATAAVCNNATTDLTTFYNTTGLTFTWTSGGNPVANPAAVGPGSYRLVATNGTCYDTAFVVISAAAPATPAVQVAITAGAQNSCAGSVISFTATPSNGGAAPAYQWKVNGANAGPNNPVFTSSTLVNGDVVSVVLTSNAACVTANTAVSNSITMAVTPAVTPSVSIAITSGTQAGCAGRAITFTATPANGGLAPAYQWKVNGVNAGTNNAVFTPAALNDGDVVTVVLTSNAACLSSNNVVSNAVTITNYPNVLPAVNISASQTVICAGAFVTFTATPVNGGTSPSYQWKINGVNAGPNNAVFTTNNLANNDVITVVLTSDAPCLSANNVSGNSITMTVNPTVTPSVIITASQTNTCAGTAITFTAAPSNGGNAPAYQWQVNGLNTGPNSPTFTSTTLANNDVVTAILTSNATCLSANNALSNAITITVNPLLTPTISIGAASAAMCAGVPQTFTASVTNGGNTPSYQWKVNGMAAGTNSPFFTSTSLQTGDVITSMLTTSVSCYTSLTALSNSLSITIRPLPVVTLSGTPEILAGGVAQLNASVNVPIANYAWTPSLSLSSSAIANPRASPDQTTNYQLQVTDSFGCKAAANILVKVVQGPLIANTFTPNNDGIHDLWEIKNLFTYPDCRIQVFTRTGQLVFESVGYSKPWNGTLNGKPLPIDTYFYILELNNRLASSPLTGYVTIMK